MYAVLVNEARYLQGVLPASCQQVADIGKCYLSTVSNELALHYACDVIHAAVKIPFLRHVRLMGRHSHSRSEALAWNHLGRVIACKTPPLLTASSYVGPVLHIPYAVWQSLRHMKLIGQLNGAG